ncbi:MAG: MMPL family transporter [Bacteroidetes bacterium]|nr:MMPL family transporter [Bacteroidota bacterium]
MWTFIIRTILRNRIAILVVLGLFTAFMAWMARDTGLAYEFAQILPETDSTRIKYDEFRSRFGEDGDMLFLGVDDPALYRLQNFNAWYDLNNAIDKIDGVDTVISLARVYHVVRIDSLEKLQLRSVIKHKPETQKELDSLLEYIRQLPFYRGLLYADSSDVTIMGITLNKKILNTKGRIRFVKEVQEVAESFSEKTGIDVHYSGLPYIRTITMQKVQSELSLFIFLAALILAVVLYVFFRSFKAVFVSLLVVGIAVVWVFGTVAIFGYKITILTGLIPPLIIVIGIPNCVFLLNKYHHEYRRHGNKIKALSTMLRKIGNATFLTNVTTASGFATFILTSSSILIEFGVVAALNILGVFLISLLVIPIISSFLEPPKARHVKHLENKTLREIVVRLLNSVMGYRTVIYISTIALVLICIIGITMIKTTGRVVDDIPRDDPMYQDLLFFEKHFNGVMPFEIVIDSRKENGIFADNAKTLYKMKKLQKVFTRDSVFAKYFSRPLSINDAVSFVYQAHKGGNAKFYQVPPPSELNKLKQYVEKAEKDRMNFRLFIDSTNRRTRFSVQMANLGTPQIQTLKDSLRPVINDIFDPAEYEVTLTGMTVVFLKGTNFLIKNLFVSLSIAIVLISLFIAAMFRSVRMVFVTILPNLIPLLFTAGLMGFFDIPIKPSTILIFSIAFGISVDDSIHFLAKYRQELKVNNWEIGPSVVEALKETGFSMIYTSIVLFFGFAIFAFSGFGGTQALGILVSITLLVAMLTNLILLPSLLLTIEKKIRARAYREPLFLLYDEEEDIELDDLRIEESPLRQELLTKDDLP